MRAKGSGCLTLFALPFAGAGVFLLYQVLQQYAEGPEDWGKFGALCAGALVFTAAGFGLLWGSRYAAKKQKEEEHLKRMHPNEPWMWKPEWAARRIEGSNKASMLVAWFFAIIWNLLSAPVLIFVPDEIFKKGNQLAWLAFIFPLAGIWMILWSVKATLRWRKFGKSVFEMAAVPGVIGGKLRGTIYTGLKTPPEQGAKLRLHCVNRRESRGSSNSSSERILWEEGHTIPREKLYPGQQGLTIPAEFVIPFDCSPTNKPDNYTQVLWRLYATAEVAGVDYETQFEVPVFKTAESSSEPIERSAFGFASAAVADTFDPAEATIIVRPSALGGTEYYYGAARNLGAAIGMTIFLIIWTGAIWLQLHLGAPIIFPILFGLVGLILVLVGLDLWFGTTRVVIESGEVRVINRTLGIGGTTRIPFAEIEDIKIGIGMQQQQTATQSGKAYYDIRIHRQNGKKVKAGTGIRNKREAEWLADQMVTLVLGSD